jgi:hypothetical protein
MLAANGARSDSGDSEWSADGKSIYFETGVKGELHLFRVICLLRRSRK